MVTKVSFSVPKNALVLLCVRVLSADIPRDAQGRLVLQLRDRNFGAKREPGIIRFGPRREKGELKAKLIIEELFNQGFRVQDMHVVREQNTKSIPAKEIDDVLQMRVYLRYADEGSTMADFDGWGVSGEFAKQKLARAYNVVNVFDNDTFISVTMCDPISKPATYFLAPKVVAPVAVSVSDPVREKLVVHGEVSQVTHGAIACAFERAGIPTQQYVMGEDV